MNFVLIFFNETKIKHSARNIILINFYQGHKPEYRSTQIWTKTPSSSVYFSCIHLLDVLLLKCTVISAYVFNVSTIIPFFIQLHIQHFVTANWHSLRHKPQSNHYHRKYEREVRIYIFVSYVNSIWIFFILWCTQISESTFISNALRPPKEQCFQECSHGSSLCAAGNRKM